MNEANTIQPNNPSTPLDDAQRSLARCLTTDHDPKSVLVMAEKQIEEKGIANFDSDGKDSVFKAMTLTELDNGALLTMSIHDVYKTFAIDLMRKLQSEYHCETPSEKATAELAALNFSRTLDIQRRITISMNSENISTFKLSYTSILSKELDRANRHYLTSLQALRALKQPALQVNIRTDTAVVGQNQIIQTNNDKPK